MKDPNPTLVFLCGIGILLLSACGDGGRKAQDASAQKQVEPTVVFQNEYAKVVKVTLLPGEALAAHEGELRLIYSLSDYSIDWTEGGQQEGVKSWKEGDVHIHGEGTHAAANSGETTAGWLAFVRRTPDLPECGENTLENDVNSVAPEYSTQLFDNDDFRATEVKLPPAAQIPMHSGVNRIIYSLTDYQIRYESDNEGVSEKTFRSGDAHWHEACMHALENIGQTEARFLVVSFK